VFESWVPALAGLAQYERVELLYWLHLSRRDLVLQSPANGGDFARHIFAETTSAPEPDRHRDCSSCRYRGRNSKRLTENELSDFSRLWHDGCVKAITEAQDVDRNHSAQV
jgi:hypothetical protein